MVSGLMISGKGQAGHFKYPKMEPDNAGLFDGLDRFINLKIQLWFAQQLYLNHLHIQHALYVVVIVCLNLRSGAELSLQWIIRLPLLLLAPA